MSTVTNLGMLALVLQVLDEIFRGRYRDQWHIFWQVALSEAVLDVKDKWFTTIFRSIRSICADWIENFTAQFHPSILQIF